MSQTIRFGLAGLLYGSVLTSIAFVSAGAGHGTYVPMGLFSSPLGVAQSIPLALVGTPILWAILGMLVGATGHRIGLVALLSLLAAHFALLPTILKKGSVFGDWFHAESHPELIVVAFVVYAIGPITILVVGFFRAWRARS